MKRSAADARGGDAGASAAEKIMADERPAFQQAGGCGYSAGADQIFE